MKRMSACLAAAAVVFVAGCGHNNSKQDEQEQIPEKKVMTVQEKDNEVFFTFPAQLRGNKDISIYPQVSGTLENVLVSEGQRVKKGQKLFQIDAGKYAAVVDDAKAAVLMAEANVETQELELSATKQLFDKGIVSEHQYMVETNSLRIAKAQLSEMKASLTRAQMDYNHTSIYAPSDGVIGNINYRQGSLVGAVIEKPLTVVSDNSMIYAYVSFNSDEYLNLLSSTGGKDEFIKTFPPSDLIIGKDFVYDKKGRTETISGMIDENTGAISVRVAFPNPDGLLSAGGSGTLRVPMKYKGFVVPRTSTFEIQDKCFVYKVVKQEDGSFNAVSSEVDVYRLNDTEYIVFDGLQAGDSIVLEGVKKMTNGMKIKPVEEN